MSTVPTPARGLPEWTSALAERLGVDGDLDARLLLQVTREVAHGVERPAGPITTFLVALAAAQRGGGRDEVARACADVRDLLAEWTADDGPGEPDGPGGAPPQR